MAELIRQGTNTGLVVETELVNTMNPISAKAVKDLYETPQVSINLKSSSASSLKVFAITVDDEGQITATEVEE